jgi:hypothetical protein
MMANLSSPALMTVWIPLMIGAAYTGFVVFLTRRGSVAPKTDGHLDAVHLQESLHTAFLARQRQLNKGG